MTTRLLPGTFAALAGCALVPLALTLAGAPPDDEDRELDEARVRQVMRDNCLICHSEELISTSRLTPAQWKTEVEKMVGWGAPLPKDEERPLTEYLARQYPPDAPAPEVSRTTLAQALAGVSPEGPIAPGDPLPGAKLYAENCVNCHGTDGQGTDLGPNLVEKPVLLRPTDYHEVVSRGRRRMPGFQTVLKPEQEHDVLAWLRGRRYQAKLPE